MTPKEHTAPWPRMRHSRAQFSGSDASCRMPWSAVCITNTSDSEFSAHTGANSEHTKKLGGSAQRSPPAR